MNSASARRSQLREFGAHLAGLDPGRFENDPGLPGLLAGALYALDRAIQLGYDETRGPDPDLRQLSIEFQDTLRAIAEKPRRIRKRWRAGFYFLSALYRLASVSDRAHEQFPDWHKTQLASGWKAISTTSSTRSARIPSCQSTRLSPQRCTLQAICAKDCWNV